MGAQAYLHGYVTPGFYDGLTDAEKQALQVLDINPVWYGIMLMINLELALITPPVGMNLFVIKGHHRGAAGRCHPRRCPMWRC